MIIDSVDYGRIKGTILDIFRWHDYSDETECIEIETDNGDYYAIDDYDIEYIEYADFKNEKNNATFDYMRR